MKTREEFLKDVFAKSERVRQAEAAALVKKKKRRRIVTGAVSAAACLTLLAGAYGILDGGLWTGSQSGDGAAGEAATLPMEGGMPVWDDGNTIGLENEAGRDAAAAAENAKDSDHAAKTAKTGDVDMDSSKTAQQAMDGTADGSSRAKPEIQGTDDPAFFVDQDTDAGELWSRDALWDTNDQIRELSVQLFKKTADAKNNSMISPVSILMAMAMVENGAEGNTKKQMEQVFGISTAELNQWIRAWTAVQPFSDADSKSRMNIANAVWYNNSGALTLNTDYQKTLQKMLQAQVRGSDFSDRTVKEINRWCSRNTYGMIDKIVEQLSPAQQMVLLNAVAFEDQWSRQYKKSQVKKEDFTDQKGNKTKTSLMYSEEDTYCQDDLAVGFIKPYQSGYAFVAILPKDGVSVADYMEKLDGKRFQNFVDSGQHAVVHAVLPAFKSEYKTDALVQIFRKMGIKDLFDGSASDLSGMGSCGGQNLYVDEILHKTYIDVNREGTRAAAVTGIMVKATSLNPEPVREYTVRLDRPFLYAIIDAQTGTPVFMGTMVSAE